MGKVKPDEPLKNKIDFAQKKLQFQISKLEGINEKLQKKHDTIFEKIVNAQRNNKNGYAQAYAGELAQKLGFEDSTICKLINTNIEEDLAKGLLEQ